KTVLVNITKVSDGSLVYSDKIDFIYNEADKTWIGNIDF
ncbi:unnamed protein product, partial [marine sediment metagenome]